MLAGGMALATLAACGRKNQPKHPEGSEFPHQYPYVPPSSANSSTLPPPGESEGGDGRDTSNFLKLDPTQNRRY